MGHPKSRDVPRISCTKLGEYMISGPGRRQTIIRDQKWPSVYRTAIYTEAQEAIAGYIRRGGKNPDLIENAIDRLSNIDDLSDWRKQSFGLCVDALKHFMQIADQLDLDGLKLRMTGNHHPKIIRSGVQISVRPELVSRKLSDGKKSSACQEIATIWPTIDMPKNWQPDRSDAIKRKKKVS